MTIGSIFFEFQLPNPTTWFYFSGLLAVALFFKFSRVFSFRNLDILTLFLFAPGLLLLAEAASPATQSDRAMRLTFWGYVWLICVNAYFLFRCLADLTLVRRPALGANLNLSGLAWLGGALFVSLLAVVGGAGRSSSVRSAPENQSSHATDTLPRVGKTAIEPYAPDAERIAERGLAVLCHLSIAVALVLIGWRHFSDVQAGMSAATFYLLLPYTFLLLPDSPTGVGRWDHAWPMALVVWTVVSYRSPMLAGGFLGLAAGTAPVVLFMLPAWVSFYRGRGASRFTASFIVLALVGMTVLGLLLWIYDGKPPVVHLDWLRLDWQPWKEPRAPFPGIWQGIHAAYRVPVLIASLALVITSAFWPNPKNLAHVLALSTASVLSVQLWYADRGGVYVLWFLPFLLLLVFRPNLSTAPVPTPPGDDWVARVWRWLAGWVSRLKSIRLKRPTAAKKEALSKQVSSPERPA